MSNLSDVSQINAQLLNPQVVKTQGAGKAYQSVAQSMAIAVQDATNYLENALIVSSAAIAVATEKIVSNPPANLPIYTPVIQQAGKTVTMAAQNFSDIGMKAAAVLKNFPSS
ncbi:hypothetical protein [Aphanothece sacrum]|nr:hypothetical protein [Aphanothece sacrum]